MNEEPTEGAVAPESETPAILLPAASSTHGGPVYPLSLFNGGATPIGGFNGDIVPPGQTTQYSGILFRDWVAATCDVGPLAIAALDKKAKAALEELVGRPQPDDVMSVAYFRFWADVMASLRYLHADAMLEAGRKEQGEV